MLHKNWNYEITIPVFNEENRLRAGIQRLNQFIDTQICKKITVIIVNNGSTDRTELIALELLQQYPNLKYIKLEKKSIGLALKTSWQQSQADVIGYMDVDLATDITHLHEVTQVLESSHCDIVNGSRYLTTSCIMNRSVLRSFLSKGFNFLLRKMLYVQFTDGMCGFKFLKRDSYLALQTAGLYNDDLFFCTELLYNAEKMGLAIHEVPVRWLDDRDSRIQLSGTIISFLIEIFKLRFRSPQATKCKKV